MKRGENIGLGAATADAAKATEETKLTHAVEVLKAAGLLPVSAPDLLARQFPPVEWIVEDLLAARGGTTRGFKGDIIAGSKMRKTFFALQLAACVSAGRDFLKSEKFAGYRVPKPRRVLYLNLELREDFTQERIKRITAALGADLSNLEIMSPARPYLLRNRYGDMDTRTGKRQLLEGFEDQFLEYANGKGFELIVADPQYKLEFPEEDENSGQGLGGILRWRDRIITETAAACLMVHHDPKSGGTDRDLTQRGAGSSFAGRDYDARLALDANADGDPLHEVLECGSRVRADPDPVTVVFDTGTFTFEVDTEIAAKRLSGQEKRKQRQSDTTGEAARGERERAQAAALKLYEDIDTEATARARKQRREPAPEDFLLTTEALENRIAERAGLSGRAAKSQIKILTAPVAGQAATLERVRELDRAGIRSGAKKPATIYIGLPVRVAAYRQHYAKLEG